MQVCFMTDRQPLNAVGRGTRHVKCPKATAATNGIASLCETDLKKNLGDIEVAQSTEKHICFILASLSSEK